MSFALVVCERNCVSGLFFGTREVRVQSQPHRVIQVCLQDRHRNFRLAVSETFASRSSS
jgi:hypothetical protein